MKGTFFLSERRAKSTHSFLHVPLGTETCKKPSLGTRPPLTSCPGSATGSGELGEKTAELLGRPRCVSEPRADLAESAPEVPGEGAGGRAAAAASGAPESAPPAGSVRAAAPLGGRRRGEGNAVRGVQGGRDSEGWLTSHEAHAIRAPPAIWQHTLNTAVSFSLGHTGSRSCRNKSPRTQWLNYLTVPEVARLNWVSLA